MKALVGGLVLLFLGVRLAFGFAHFSAWLIDRFFPNARVQRFAPGLVLAGVGAASFLCADLLSMGFWWTAIAFVSTGGAAGWVISSKEERERAEARQVERLANLKHAQEIYRRYEAAPHLLSNADFRIEFYRYWNWSLVRADVISAWRKGDRRCGGCGTFIRGKSIHVDHIRPRSKYPNLRYLKSNLQVLCDRCNRYKHDYDGEDWREVVVDRKKAHVKRRRTERARLKSRE